MDVGSVPLANDNAAVDSGKEMVVDVTPTQRDGRKIIGIDVPFPSVHVKLGAIGAFEKSLQVNKENAVLIFQVIGRLIKRQASLRQLDGPVGIVAVSGQAYEAGFATLLTFMAVISSESGHSQHFADSDPRRRCDLTLGDRVAYGPRFEPADEGTYCSSQFRIPFDADRHRAV